jgi:5-methylcytosine-specific restriction endonuclease McrA
MSRTRRCAGCREYFDADSMVELGIVAYCTMACFNRKQATAVTPRVDRFDRCPPSVKKSVRLRDQGLCRLCGRGSRKLYRGDGLDVHHIVYRSESGKHDVFEDGVHDEMNLILLCLECHDMVHSDKGRYQDALLEIVDLTSKGEFLTPAQIEERMTQHDDLYVNGEYGTVCFAEHARRKLSVDKSFTFCDCKLTDRGAGLEMDCVKSTDLDQDQHDDG